MHRREALVSEGIGYLLKALSLVTHPKRKHYALILRNYLLQQRTNTFNKIQNSF